MNNATLRKVQLTQLEIAKEVKRICDLNNIEFFLDSGTLIGAVRHKGFIPWDDDLDIGMMRESYDYFCEIAPQYLSDKYYLQTWENDKAYPYPFAKIRKKGTLYVEDKAQKREGIYVDVFPFDYAPSSTKERNKLTNKRVFIFRCLLVKHNYKPWKELGKINWKKYFGYQLYRLFSVLPHSFFVKSYKKSVEKVAPNEEVYEQIGKRNTVYFNKSWLTPVKQAEFEKELFPIPNETDKRLFTEYGDYMTLPPEEQRENRHGIIEVNFGE